MRKLLINKDYKTIKTDMIKYEVILELHELEDLLLDNIQDMSRSDLIETAKVLNNLLFKIEES